MEVDGAAPRIVGWFEEMADIVEERGENQIVRGADRSGQLGALDGVTGLGHHLVVVVMPTLIEQVDERLGDLVRASEASPLDRGVLGWHPLRIVHCCCLSPRYSAISRAVGATPWKSPIRLTRVRLPSWRSEKRWNFSS